VFLEYLRLVPTAGAVEFRDDVRFVLEHDVIYAVFEMLSARQCPVGTRLLFSIACIHDYQGVDCRKIRCASFSFKACSAYVKKESISQDRTD
jgi:hypothetical protein